MALGIGIIHLDLRDVAQHSGGTVLRTDSVEQLGRVIDELRVALARREDFVIQDVRDERDVRLHAADVDLGQRADRSAAHALEGVVPARDLDQQRVIVRRNDRAGGGVSAVETDAEAAARTVRGDAAVIRREVILGILGGDPALDRVAVDPQVVLTGQTDHRVGQRVSLGDQDLRADEVNAGDLLGDRVLDLDTRVHLDEVVLSGLRVHEELDGTGVHVVHLPRDLYRVGSDGRDRIRIYRPGGRVLDDLLVAALQRAVTLAQMHDVSVLVREDLHFDVLRLDEELLDEDVLVSESLSRLVLNHLELAADVLVGVAASHAASAAAGGSLQDDRIAVFVRDLNGLVRALQRLGRAGNDRDAAGDRGGLRRQLIAHLRQDARRRSDELNAGLFTGPREIRILRKEAVTGMNRGSSALLRQVDDAGNIQISAQRRLVLTDQVSLIRLNAEQAVRILVRVHGQSADTQVIARAEDTDCDLTAVRSQYFFEFLCHSSPLLIKTK